MVLDSRALTDWIGEDRKVLARFALYHSLGAEFVISVGAVTGALAGLGLGLGLGLDRAQPGAPTATATVTATAALHRALSRLDVEPVTEAAAWAAVELLDAADLHGDSYALKATVVESALRRPVPVILLTSDVGDMTALCGDRAGSVRMIGL
ncbi:DNA-binding protein [Streptomyces sp. H27-H1]|nr:DNA-binding protein [Streptomyces sp. H27-H1]